VPQLLQSLLLLLLLPLLHKSLLPVLIYVLEQYPIELHTFAMQSIHLSCRRIAMCLTAALALQQVVTVSLHE
jgi:hypothetical protein